MWTIVLLMLSTSVMTVAWYGHLRWQYLSMGSAVLLSWLIALPEGFLLLAYNLEWFGGRFHRDSWFALSWGAFPLLTAFFAQTGRISIGALAASAGAFALSYGQRSLSTPARLLRRRSRSVTGIVELRDGTQVRLDEAALLRPLEQALRAFSWGVVALAVGLAATRFF